MTGPEPDSESLERLLVPHELLLTDTDPEGVQTLKGGAWVCTRRPWRPGATVDAGETSVYYFEPEHPSLARLGMGAWRGPEPLIEVVSAFGRFLLDAGPLRLFLRMDDFDGIYLLDAFMHYSFWPQTDGTVRVVTWPRSRGRPALPPYLPKTLPPVFPGNVEFYRALMGPLHHRIRRASASMVEVLTALCSDVDDDPDVTLPYLLDLAEAVAARSPS